jgi:integrase
MLQVMLAHAISLDLIAVNPARDVRVIGRRDQEMRRIVPPSKEVLRQLLGLADEKFRVKLLFAAATGVRAGELHALRWRHVEFERREVRIETRVDSFHDEDVPKTKAGLRTIPLGGSLVQALQFWRKSTSYPGKDDLVFPNRHGRYYNHRGMIKYKFDPLFDKLKNRWQEERHNEPLEIFNWHALRHFAISCWIEAGLPAKTVQTFAGHSSLQVTMDRYGHLFRSEHHGQVMDAIGEQICASAAPERGDTPKPAAKSDWTLG